MAMPRVAVQKAGLRANPQMVPRSLVSLRESKWPRSGSGTKASASASRKPGTAAT